MRSHPVAMKLVSFCKYPISKEGKWWDKILQIPTKWNRSEDTSRKFKHLIFRHIENLKERERERERERDRGGERERGREGAGERGSEKPQANSTKKHHTTNS